MIDQRIIGKNMLARMKQLSLSRYDLARRTGKSTTQIATYLKQGNMSLQTLAQMAEALNCKMSDLLDGIVNNADTRNLADRLSDEWPWVVAHHVLNADGMRTENRLNLLYEVYVPELVDCIGLLSPREQDILEMHYKQRLSFDKCGARYQQTGEWAKQEELSALKKLGTKDMLRKWFRADHEHSKPQPERIKVRPRAEREANRKALASQAGREPGNPCQNCDLDIEAARNQATKYFARNPIKFIKIDDLDLQAIAKYFRQHHRLDVTDDQQWVEAIDVYISNLIF